MKNIQVVLFHDKRRTRGAIVHEPEKFIEEHPECSLCPLNLCLNIEVYEFKTRINNLPAVKWAWFWLKKKDNRAKSRARLIDVPLIRKEVVYTKRQAIRDFQGTIRKAHSLRRKKEKCVAGAFNNSLF